MVIYAPIVMYCLRLFSVVLHEPKSPSFVALHLLVSEIAKCIA